MNGIIKQPAVDTYNTGSNSLASVYGLTPTDNGSNGEAKENGWDVLVRKENTRYNWNGSQWVNLETELYDEQTAKKSDVLLSPDSAGANYNLMDSFFVLDNYKICIRKSGFQVLSNTGVPYQVQRTKDGVEGTDKIFGWDATIINSTQFLVLDKRVFDNKGVAWIDDDGLLSMVGDQWIQDYHIILAAWYQRVLDPKIGIVGKVLSHYKYNKKVSIIPHYNNKPSFRFEGFSSTYAINEIDAVLYLNSFLLNYQGVAYLVKFDKELSLVNSFGKEDSENSYLTSFELNISQLLMDMSPTRDANGFLWVQITEDNFSDYFLTTNNLRGTKITYPASRMLERNDNLELLSMYRKVPTGGILFEHTVIELNKLRLDYGKMFCVFPESNLLHIYGNMLHFYKFFMIYIDGAYYRINADNNSYQITIPSHRTLVIDTTKLVKNVDNVTVNKLSEVTRLVVTGSYRSTDIPIAQFRDNAYLMFYGLFANYVASMNVNSSTVYQINRSNFLSDFYSVSETKIDRSWHKRLNLLHMTDSHINSEDSKKNIHEAIQISKEANVNISAIINTGDLTNGLSSDTVSKEKVLEWYRANRDIYSVSTIPALLQLGNHDANDSNRNPLGAITKAEQWDNLFQAVKTKWNAIVWGDEVGKRHYQYFDIAHPLGAVRVIMLDMLDHDLPVDAEGKLIYQNQGETVYSQKQIDWLCYDALNVPKNTGIIICNHFAFMKTGTIETSLLIASRFAQGWELVPDIVNAWQNKATLSRQYADINNYQNINVDVDFSNRDNESEFICYLCGHTHFRTHLKVEGYNQLILMEDSSGERGTGFSRLVRIKNSPTSNAFSSLSIDRSEGNIYRVAYGAYKDYDEVSSERIEVISYRIL